MKQNLISIIVPIYNIEPYLKCCLDSIINQSYLNLEIILVDDGSTDNSGKICDNYAKIDKRVKVIHKKNGGLSDARNAGIKNSHGDFITFVDSDDYIDKNYVEKLKELIDIENADIAIVNRYEVKDDNIIIPKYYSKIKSINNNSLKTIIDLYNDIVPHEAWGKLYRKRIFEKYSYKKGLKLYEDIEFITRVLTNEDLYINYSTDQYLYYYRKRNDSIMHETFNELWNEEIMFYMDLYKKISDIDFKKGIALEIQAKSARNLSKIITYNFSDYKLLKSELKFLRENLKSISHSIVTKGKKDKIKVWLLLYMPYIYEIYRKMKYIKMYSFKKKFERYIKMQKLRNDNLYLIFNGPNTGNLGDHAILFGEEKFLRDMKKEPFCISANEMIYFFILNLDKEVNNSDYIYITGGGNIGTLWRNEQERINKVLETFKDNPIVIFPQTIFYEKSTFGDICTKIDIEFYNKCDNLTIYCRDQKSIDFVKEVLHKNAELKKDMALCLNYRNMNKNRKRKDILICMRNDKEKVMDNNKLNKLLEEIKNKYPNEKIKYIDTVINIKRPINYYKGKKEFTKLIKKISKSKLVVTDRLHGMILSVISDTPCIAYNNSSGKVKGVYETIKYDKVNVEFRED